MGGRSNNSNLRSSNMSSATAVSSATTTNNNTNLSTEVPAQYKLSVTGEDARDYFGWGAYTSKYTVSDFVSDDRKVTLYGGIDFARSSASYEPQRIEYEEAHKRWSRQIQYNRQMRNTSTSDLVAMSENKLKTLYAASTSEENRRRIGAQLATRGLYRSENGKWKRNGGGR